MSEILNSVGGPKGILALGAAATALGGVIKSGLVRIEQGEMGVRTRFGKAAKIDEHGNEVPYGIVGPGIHTVMPFTHSIKKISTQQRTDNMRDMKIMCDDEQLLLEASLRWSVRADGDNPYKAAFKAESNEELRNTILSICAGGLGKVFSEMQGANLAGRHDEVEAKLKESCSDKVGEFGVRIDGVDILPVSPTHGEMMRKAIREGQGNVGPNLIALDDAV